jgi:hypothetical protein
MLLSASGPVLKTLRIGKERGLYFSPAGEVSARRRLE